MKVVGPRTIVHRVFWQFLSLRDMIPQSHIASKRSSKLDAGSFKLFLERSQNAHRLEGRSPRLHAQADRGGDVDSHHPAERALSKGLV